MTTKVTCNLCDRALAISGSLVAFVTPQGMPQLRMTAGLDRTYGDVDICRYCIIDAFNKLDDRPKPDKSPDKSPAAAAYGMSPAAEAYGMAPSVEFLKDIENERLAEERTRCRVAHIAVDERSVSIEWKPRSTDKPSTYPTPIEPATKEMIDAGVRVLNMPHHPPRNMAEAVWLTMERVRRGVR